MECQNCGKTNATGSRFCQHCGVALSMAPTIPSTTEVLPNFDSKAYGQEVQAKHSGIGQIGSGGTANASIWGPFAGYGTRGRHVSWLLDNIGDKAEALHEAVTQRFRQREVPSSQMAWRNLVARGVLVERRPFYFVRRGITTVALYIARFGKDLYISQVTYTKGPIGQLRVILLGLVVLFQLYVIFGYANSVTSSLGGMFGGLGGFFGFGGDGGSVLSLPVLLCVVGPLALLNTLVFYLVIIYSIYKYITEKDLLAILRTRPNEFQVDDAVALEKAVEETVRQSLDALGIDAALMPPSQELNFASRSRLI